MISRPILFERFAGRDDVMIHLGERRRAAAAGRGGLVLVAGEAGIGKTRLVSEFLAPLRRGHTRVARAACREFAQTAFGPLEECLSALDPSRVARAFSSVDDHFASIVGALETLAAGRTTVISIEDLHWAEPELLEVLEAVARSAAHTRLMVIGTYRDNEIVLGHRNVTKLVSLLREPSTTQVKLDALPGETMARLMSDALSARQTGPVGALVLSDVAVRSEGNPFFGEELLRSAVDRASAPATAGTPIPLTIQAVIAERIARCSPQERELLELAAVCGRRFERDVAIDLLAIDERHVDERIAALSALQLIARPGERHVYEFRHALTRELLLATIDAQTRRPLHRRIARWLEAEPDAVSRVLEIAYHRWEAGERETAASVYEAAAKAARAELAYSDAIRWYERAVQAFAGQPGDAVRVEIALGTTLVAAMDDEAGIAVYERVASSAVERRDWETLVRVRKLVAGSLSNDGFIDRAIALLEATMNELPVEADRTTAAAELNLRVASYQQTRQIKDVARRTFAAIDPATFATDDPRLAEYHLVRSTFAAAAFDEKAWCESADIARDIYRRIEAPMFVRFSHVNMALQALGIGHLSIAREQLRSAMVVGGESAASLNDVPGTAAVVAVAGGNLNEAQAWIDKISAGSEMMSRKLRATAAVEVAAARGDLDGVRRSLDFSLLEEATAREDVYGEVQLACAFALGAIALSRTDEAARLFDRAADAISSAYRFAAVLPTIARHRPSAGARARAAVAADAARQSSDFVRSCVALADAELAAHAGDDGARRMHAAAARTGLDAAGWSALAARSYELEGQVVEATRRFRACGYMVDVRRIARDGESRADTLAALLTPREREIAVLVARGSSNRHVAETLSLSAKTVEKHLSAAFDKLGVHSRAALRDVVDGSSD